MSGEATDDAAQAQPDDTQPDDTHPDDIQPEETRPEETQVDEALDALADVKQRLADVPAEVVVANHVMGLYELAAIHLGAEPPRLAEAALAIDAVGCLVEGLGARLGPDAAALNDALSNIRLAFVQIKKVATPT